MPIPGNMETRAARRDANNRRARLAADIATSLACLTILAAFALVAALAHACGLVLAPVGIMAAGFWCAWCVRPGRVS